jgi:hypothetical protein
MKGHSLPADNKELRSGQQKSYDGDASRRKQGAEFQPCDADWYVVVGGYFPPLA